VCGVCGVWGLCGVHSVACGVWLAACGVWRVVCGMWATESRACCCWYLVCPPALRASTRPDILRLELLEDLQASAQRMESTVNDVLVLRQLDQHYLVPEVESCDLGRLVATTCQGCRAFFRDDVALAYRVVAPQGAVVMMDGRRLAQILVNVLRWAWSVGRGA
jgi:signal transduction histidine kinase